MTKVSKYQSKPADSNGIVPYDKIESDTWSYLLKRQSELVKPRACKEFLQGIELLSLSEQVPQHFEITEVLQSQTGWAIEPVNAIIPAEDFFTLLSKKKFPCANFIRTPDEMDYLKEPDIFHEVFGHSPLLTHQGYADYMQEYGKLALSVSGKLRMRLFRLFWFTIEFGLVKENNEFKAYGGGILSSSNETVYSIDSDIPERLILDDPMDAFRTPYRLDILQPVYFALNSLSDLFKLFEYDLLSLAKKSLELGNYPAKFEPKK